MNVQVKAGPTAMSPTTPTTASPAAQDARARAIAKLQGATPAAAQSTPVSQGGELPVKNANSVSPEELSIVKTAAEPQEGQSSTSEEASASAEAPKEVKPEASKEEPLSSQYAQLARKEKAIRAKANEIRAKELDIQAREAAIKAKEAPSTPTPQSLKDLVKGRNPVEVLSELGLSYDEVTQIMLNQPQAQQDYQQRQVIEKLEGQIKALTEKIEGTNKTFQTNQEQQYQQAVNQIRNETKALVNSDENFETIKATNSVDDVVELIEKTFKDDGVLLSVEEAAKAVEDYLVDEAIKIGKLKKIQQRLNPPSSPKAAAPKSTGDVSAQSPAPMKTLTNAIGTQAKLSARQRAILAAEGKLGK